jgi:hypothetical protein
MGHIPHHGRQLDQLGQVVFIALNIGQNFADGLTGLKPCQ